MSSINQDCHEVVGSNKPGLTSQKSQSFPQLLPRLDKISVPPVIFLYWGTASSSREVNLKRKGDLEKVGPNFINSLPQLPIS